MRLIDGLNQQEEELFYLTFDVINFLTWKRLTDIFIRPGRDFSQEARNQLEKYIDEVD